MDFIIMTARTKEGQIAFFGRHHEHTAYFNELSALPEMAGWDMRLHFEKSSPFRAKVELDPTDGQPYFSKINLALTFLGNKNPIVVVPPQEIVRTVKVEDIQYGAQIYLSPPASDKGNGFNAVKHLKQLFARQQNPAANDAELAAAVENLGVLPLLEFKQK